MIRISSGMKFLLLAWLGAGLVVARAAEPVAVTSLNPVLSDFATQVGGDRIALTNLLPPGRDPHDFHPTPKDLQSLSTARVILASGLGMEHDLDKMVSGAGNQAVVVVAGKAIKPILAPESGSDRPDPHWWHRIDNARIATRLIRDALIKVDPAGKSIYQANTKAYLAQLDALEKWTRITVAQLPRQQRVLVTSHDALGYFARDYDFEILPVAGLSTEDQPSSKKVRELIVKVQSSGVKAIFAENTENPKVLEEITRETGAKLGGTLYADGLGRDEATTYETMMRHNVETIVNALK